MKYIASALDPTSWPRILSPKGNLLPEIALAGRSNVGKSTLINCLAGQKKLAKVSATPGKTQRMQFFCWNEQLILVDLPGYGFAKAPPAIRSEWSEAIDHYLNHRSSLKKILLLLDIRRIPSIDDLHFIEWAQNRAVPLLIVFTKTDMLSPRENERRHKEIFEKIGLREYIDIPNSSRKIWSAILRNVNL